MVGEPLNKDGLDYHTVTPILHCLILPLLCLSSCLPYHTHFATLHYFTPQLHVFLYSSPDISPVFFFFFFFFVFCFLSFDGDAIFSINFATLHYSVYLNFHISPYLPYTFLSYLTIYYRLVLIGTDMRLYDKCCHKMLTVGQHRY